MRVRVTGCVRKNWWYKDIIGEEFEVEEEPEDSSEGKAYHVLSLEDARKLVEFSPHTVSVCILVQDCEIIKEFESNISELFEQKVTELRGFHKGEKVYYKRHNIKENGIIKSIEPGNQAFVVYKCADDWDNYQNYTGTLTPLDYLKLGWYDSQNIEV